MKIDTLNKLFSNADFETISKYSALTSDFTTYLVYKEIAFLQMDLEEVKKYENLYLEAKDKLIEFITGIYNKNKDKLKERLTIIYPNGVDPNYVIARWENKNSVWQLNHVYTFSQVTALAFRKEIIEPK